MAREGGQRAHRLSLWLLGSLEGPSLALGLSFLFCGTQPCRTTCSHPSGTRPLGGRERNPPDSLRLPEAGARARLLPKDPWAHIVGAGWAEGQDQVAQEGLPLSVPGR